MATLFSLALSAYDPQGVFHAEIATDPQLNTGQIDAIPKVTAPKTYNKDGSPILNPRFEGSKAWLDYLGGTIFDMVELRAGYVFRHGVNVARLRVSVENGRFGETGGGAEGKQPLASTMETYVRRAGRSDRTAPGKPCVAPTEAELPR